MADIDFNQLLANAGVFVACGSVLGGFLARYAKSIGREQIAMSIAAFEKERFDPVIQRLDEKVTEMAALSGRMMALEGSVMSLDETVKDQAHQHRKDITGLGTRLEGAQNHQTNLLVELIKANK